MATLVIKKELCAKFRRKGRWILAIFIIILAVCAFKVTKKFKHLHREIRELKSNEFVSNDRFSAYERYNDRKILSLETKISDMTNRGNPQSLDNILEIIRAQRQEIRDLTVQLRTIQQNQVNPQTNLQNTKIMEGLQTQMRALSDNLEQMRRENELLKRQQLEMTQKYEKALLMTRDDVDQGFKQATHKKLSELANANYGHEQTFKEVQKSLDNCAKQASLIALEAYIDDKLSTSTPQNSQGSAAGNNLPVLRELQHMKRDLAQLSSQNDETKVSLTKLAYDQKLNNQRVTALETQQQEDEKLKTSFNDASTFIEKTLKDSGILNQKDFEKNLSDYLKAVEKTYSEIQEKFGRAPEQNMNFGQGHFGRRHHYHHPHNRRIGNMEPPRIHERDFGQKQQPINSFMNHNNLAQKTPEELIQLMDQLLASN